jgi:hypothetical protein
MRGRPLIPPPSPGNMSGASKGNSSPGDVFPKDSRRKFRRRMPHFLLPPPGTMVGASQDSFSSGDVFLK